MKKRTRKINKRIDKYSKLRRNKKLVVFLFIAILFIGVFFLLNYTLVPRLTLNDEKSKEKIGSSITINYNTKYKSPKYSATYLNKNVNDKVKVEGSVNPKKIGNYKLTYIVKEGLITKRRTLIVKVRDLSKPTIKLVGLDKTYICPDKDYKEEGYEAYDNLDGNITKKVSIKRHKNKIFYSVTDKNGNKKTLERELIYKDKDGPIIELNDGLSLNAYQGEKFVDPGFKATDNCDGDVTKDVKITGKVDINKFGKYSITYTVSDKEENKSTITREINVIERGQNGTIYLTFDDGPKEGITNVILDILRDENIKATFFVTGKGPDELIKRAYDEGHTIGLHTSTHDYSYLYSSVQNFYNDLYAIRNRVKSITGYESNITRFPGGSSNTISRRYSPGIMSTLTTDIVSKGFKYYDWNLMSGDAGEIRNADGIYNNVSRLLSKDRVNIVLMHDIKPYTRDSLQRIIRYGKDNGYNFDKITEKTEMMTQRVNN